MTLLVVGAPAAGVVAAQDDGPPSPPATYYGEVTVDGGNPGQALLVEAVVDGQVQDSITTAPNGSFGGPGAFDEKLEVGAENGTEVVFRVEGATAGTVEWTAGANREVSLSIDAVPEPNFAVAIDSGATDDAVTAGDALTVTATVTNDGTADGTATVDLVVDGSTVDTTTVSPTAGAETTVRFEHSTEPDTDGSISVAVETSDDERRPPEYVRFTGRSRVMSVRGEHELEAVDGGTRLTNRFVVDGRIPGVERFFKRNFDAELDRLEEALRADIDQRP